MKNKFRLWDVKNKMWTTPAILKIDINGEMYYQRDGEHLIYRFTGLHDKNGIEGCHQDIVRMNHFLYTIEWDNKLAKFYLKSTNPLNTVKWSMAHFKKYGEVIGNIHENPELFSED